MRGSQTYPFSLAAGGSIPILCNGSYFKLITCTGAIEVTGDKFGRTGNILAGQGLRGAEFNRLTITDKSGAPNIGVIFVADEDFVDDRITGEVSVIDGEKARSLAAGVLSAGGVQNATAGNLSSVQLWNPSTTKNLILRTLSHGTGAASLTRVYGAAVALANDITAISASNLLIGGGIGVAQIRAAANIAVMPGFANNLIASIYSSGLVNVPHPMKGSIVIQPNKGVTLTAGVVNVDLIANLEWFEENV